jgi:predicted nuclease of restriction endonuclease-like (RecB) superfamily
MKRNVPALAGYAEFLDEVKNRVRAARISAARAVNRDLILLYWDIGRGIVERQHSHGWGESVVEVLARDLQRDFPDMRGVSARNLWYLRRLFADYAEPKILQQLAAEFGKRGRRLPAGSEVLTKLQQLAAEIPWGHHMLLMDRVTDAKARLYYIQAVARLGWTRALLLNQIKAQAYERARAEKKTHNFAVALPEHFAEQADEAMKSRYNLEFLGIAQAARDRELEDRLINELQRFILELGYGFCFVGRQHRLVLGEKEYFIDLLFYHRFLKALVAFELKVRPFEPEFAGKMDFYLNVLNEKERGPDDQPSIGIILCAQKDGLEVEFALKSKANPIGVAEYQLQPSLPAELKGKLPSAKQLADAVQAALPAGKPHSARRASVRRQAVARLAER